MQVKTTAELECDNRGAILSARRRASPVSCGIKDIIDSRM